ncbi:SH3 domain-containing protein [Leptolinea tardivitalis]|uniref:SH3b domain-containing protein n=1 Tax=Leptolinea tardivitalis TaxID=229920 RepID=A0A0P6WQL5_9CHLR|nr:SH3 domain-containing protein [Leptolinea tardivitalis]KPL71118.1 hypothetical protein ADM99_12690 [Leptolinea tardivitalis]GAP22549.1 hypothetical protein LTAR_02781 [Leptolinea tardivitalis]
MKRASLFFLLVLLMTACNSGKPAESEGKPTSLATEIPCPGVTPRGVIKGGMAYTVINGSVLSVDLYSRPESSEKIASIEHHIRVTVQDGPVCSSDSAWWQVALLDGKKGWLQIGNKIKAGDSTYELALEPYKDDAVQRDVPDNRKTEAQIRYIVADIELGGSDVRKYYEDQIAARPDDPETDLMKTAIDIIQTGKNGQVLANASAFERKPLRGGTSVVDAGTEYVQPGLDIILTPCDGAAADPVCAKLKP